MLPGKTAKHRFSLYLLDRDELPYDIRSQFAALIIQVILIEYTVDVGYCGYRLVTIVRIL